MVVGELAEQRDLIIIGGGPGGYQAAIRAAQLGQTVTLIEKDIIGGVCLNKGCIPSKVFTHTAAKLASVRDLQEMGIGITGLNVDFSKLQQYKHSVIERLRAGVEKLLVSNQIEVITGQANFIGDHKIGVEKGHQFDVYEFTNAIIATGSHPDWHGMAQEQVLTPESVYQLTEIPESIVIYGNDYRALEVASCFNQLGASVKLFHGVDFPFDASINREIKRILKKAKIQVKSGYRLTDTVPKDGKVSVQLTKNGETIAEKASYLLVCAGQKPNLKDLGVERIGIDLTADGFIQTDRTAKTSVPHIYAAGDVTGGALTAVKAIKEGKAAAETIAGLKSEIDLTLIPSVVHTNPPIAAVGLTKKEATDAGYDTEIGSFPMNGNSYAAIANTRGGLVTVIKEKKTDILLGIHMIGHGAIELSSTAVTALEMAARDEDLIFPSYPHPSFNESLLESVEELSGIAIHVPKSKR
ncbi:dihydrolipoyl dehydrogenase family protein [Virgibacillus siamensis]|uniref:dihydrolipoyl dehydrogenase family protein n=1 Tax=Virgibacillus siamensis TaxID=480071 RepID=UPI000984DF02|nr:FAD-dependent oxidoreductase [Virgibacillus siamensis]